MQLNLKVQGATHCRFLRSIVRQLCDGDTSRPFQEMPGPRSLPVVGTLYKYLPVFGEYQFDRLHWNGAKKLAKYGAAVREEIVKGTSIVWLFDPNDIETLFRHGEGKHPQRLSHLALQHFRLTRPAIYNTGGLLPTNGPDWARLRTTFQRALSKPQSVQNYVPKSDEVANDFLRLIEKRATAAPAENFLNELSRVTLELIGLVTFDERMGGLSERSSPMCDKILEAAFTANSCILGTDNGLRLWQKFKTPLYKKLEQALLQLEKVAIEFVEKKAAGARDKADGQPLSLLEQYLASPDLDRKDVIGMMVDMLLGGADTTTYSSSFALYHLAVNPDKQLRLQEEARSLLPTPEVGVTTQILSGAAYTKAVLKESLRLNPVSVGVGRILQHDAVFSGFKVPKGTVIVTQNQVTCRQSRYFENPNEFLPERWIRGHALMQNVHPYLSLPFGHGPRACIAKRLAEQNIQILLLKIAREFHITWHGDGALDCKSLLINKPDKPLRLQFHKLKD
ncbi:cytochrome P450 302a1, mitochondrial [Neocloeon triangulifer]|uniref:cytochrome P450 302a1, mitochondrial n=1 Tax=Neocloeon triangulifer TaxID=2078957 RepID=UPI00286ECBCC|nr:cytochrome P450 302a1, mitochondrial [Neocloeon triangulifer]